MFETTTLTGKIRNPTVCARIIRHLFILPKILGIFTYLYLIASKTF